MTKKQRELMDEAIELAKKLERTTFHGFMHRLMIEKLEELQELITRPSKGKQPKGRKG